MLEDARLINRFPALKRLALRQNRPTIPVVRQLAGTDCGAAALSMVLGYYGKTTSLDELRKALGTGRNGCTVTSLLRVGRAYNLRGRAVRVEIADLNQIPKAAILHWEFGHFVILECFKGQQIGIIDPAFGRRTVSMDVFRRAFTGVALLFEPTDAFERGAVTRKPAVARLFRQILEESGLLGRIISTSVLTQILSAILPLFTGIVIDRVVPDKSYSLLLVLAVGYVAFQLFQILLGFLRAHLLIYFQTKLEARFTLRFLDHLIDLPYSFFQQHTAGDLMVRMGSNNAIRDLLTSTTLSTLLDGTVASVYLVLLLIASLPLTAAVALLALARFGLLVLIRHRQRMLLAETLENQARSQTFQVEMLSGMETLKGMGLDHRAAERWSNMFIDGLNVGIRRSKLGAISSAFSGLVGIVASIVLTFYATLLVLNGTMTLGTMIAFGALAAGFLGPLNSLSSSVLQLQFIEIYLDRLNDVMVSPLEQEGSSILVTAPLSGAIALDHVSFRYGTQDELVLREISLEIRPGQRIAIVGRTGSGKSTLARLLAGLYEPSSGRILFDDTDLKHLDRRSLRSHLGIVTQETQLFGGSIRSNIALSDPGMDLDRVIRAARLACIHDEIMAMPMAYETPLTDRGLSLSGGQRQRLAIARALASKPDILVLDEATSHLDAATETKVNHNLASLHCTRIVIAQRLTTIRDADAIVVIDAGTIIELGTHDQLLRQNRKYVTLLGLQRIEEEQIPPIRSAVRGRSERSV